MTDENHDHWEVSQCLDRKSSLTSPGLETRMIISTLRRSCNLTEMRISFIPFSIVLPYTCLISIRPPDVNSKCVSCFFFFSESIVTLIKLLTMVYYVVCFLLGNSPALNYICRHFGRHCSIFILLILLYTYLRMNMEQSVPKCRHIKFRCRGNSQKKACSIQSTAEVWNQEYYTC